MNDLTGIASSLSAIKDKVGDMLSDTTQAVHDVMSKGSDIGSLGAETMKSLADDVNHLLPAIKQAGYNVSSLNIDAALPPKIALSCQMEIDVPEDERAKLLESLADSRMSVTAVQMLFRVSDVQKTLKVGTLRPSEVILELGLSPAVRIRYREADVTA
jgi:hypothetical protein